MTARLLEALLAVAELGQQNWATFCLYLSNSVKVTGAVIEGGALVTELGPYWAHMPMMAAVACSYWGSLLAEQLRLLPQKARLLSGGHSVAPEH